jgi:hypothetical protein
MDKNKTAVEWLLSQLNNLGFDYQLNSVKDVIEKAKAMEKHQQRLIYEGLILNVGTSIKKSDLPTFEEYYNGTYG